MRNMFPKTGVKEIREKFAEAYASSSFVEDKTGCKTVELIGATFVADEPTVFGTVNEDYVSRELEWYKSMSLNVNDIPGSTPKIWKDCATPEGKINSNYGYLVWSEANGSQYSNVLAELRRNPNSRRAQMIYTRPSMWSDYNAEGMSDFVCTDAVQYFVRNGSLHADVRMRSNDVWAGYRNDYAWQKYVLDSLAKELNVASGVIVWHVGSLHCYERNFYLLEGYNLAGRHDLTKQELCVLKGEK